MPATPAFPAPLLTVKPWCDPVIDQVGHDPRSAYVERYWLSVLGPTSAWLMRRLVARLDESPEGSQVEVAAVAAELGLGAKAGRHSPFVRTLLRCVRFGLVEVVADDTILVRRKLPTLTRFQVERLPAHLRAQHLRWSEEQLHIHRRTLGERREEARGLALSVVAQGVTGAAAERALHQRSIHPALAHEAVAWAVARGVSMPVRAADLPPEAA